MEASEVKSHKINISPKIKNDLKRVEEKLIQIVSSGDGRLAQSSLVILEAGGKRLRPALVLISGAMKHYDLKKLMPAAIAVELIHMASLVHDDIVDGAEMRRGVPTINFTWGSHIATATGDFLFATAFVLLSKLDNSRAMDIMSQTVLDLSLGELHQMETAHSLAQTIDDYLTVVRNKTATLFSASCQLGGSISGAREEDIEALKIYGENLGMAFQIFDDLLDLSAEKGSLGKPIGADLRGGTITMPILFALEETELNSHLCRVISGGNSTEGEIEKAIQIIHGTRALLRTREEANKYVEKAIDALSSISSEETRRNLLSIGNFVVDRYQ
ncbi:MAG: polyprenyl synthetase family protein [Actinomycetota bacterium]|nr:polyprenyl synthetase family protein [Actinomycetota bacterium]